MNQFQWFMCMIRGTRGKSGRDRLVISDYDLIPIGDPLREFYPPTFRSVADCVIWDGDTFPSGVGMLSTKCSIDWDDPKTVTFIPEAIDEHRELLFRAYNDDFVPQRKRAALLGRSA